MAGPDLSSSAFHCVTVGAEEAVEAANRASARYWREVYAVAPAAEHAVTDPEWREVVSPDGVKYFVARFRQHVVGVKQPTAKTAVGMPNLSIPDFLKRTNSTVTATAVDEPAPCNGAGSNQVALKKESNDVG